MNAPNVLMVRLSSHPPVLVPELGLDGFGTCFNFHNGFEDIKYVLHDPWCCSVCSFVDRVWPLGILPALTLWFKISF